LKEYRGKRGKGQEAETVACVFLKERGYKIIQRNFKTKFGEIDIIASKGNVLCFVEVKSGENLNFLPEWKVNSRKMEKIKKTALAFLKKTAKDFEECRFDVISIKKDKIDFIEGAFTL